MMTSKCDSMFLHGCAQFPFWIIIHIMYSDVISFNIFRFIYFLNWPEVPIILKTLDILTKLSELIKYNTPVNFGLLNMTIKFIVLRPTTSLQNIWSWEKTLETALCPVDWTFFVWLKLGDLAAFVELELVTSSTHLGPLRPRVGGLATIFRDHFKCHLLTGKDDHSFELQLFILELTYPVICALVHGPPTKILFRNFLISYLWFCQLQISS